MNNAETRKTINQSVRHTLTIEILRDLTTEQLEYIFDCWCAFWTGDFGYYPNEYSMTLQ